MTTQFQVSDASCGHCKATIESAVSALGDVNRVDFDLDSKTLIVEHGDAVRADDVSKAIRDAGYTPEVVR